MTHAAPRRKKVTPIRKLTLDELQSMSMGALEQAYRSAPCPDEMGVLAGAPRGSVLAVAALDQGTPARLRRAITASSLFPWAGKSFSAVNERHGKGINRINLLGLAAPTWFGFETVFADSCIDGKPCIKLDYDLPQNPFFIRAIVDELRMAAPGLLFGPAQIRIGQRQPVPVLYFALTYS